MIVRGFLRDQLNVPVLGICYGMQTMAAQLGGQVASAESLGKAREFGYAEVRARGHTDLLNNIEDHRTADRPGIGKSHVRNDLGSLYPLRCGLPQDEIASHKNASLH